MQLGSRLETLPFLHYRKDVHVVVVTAPLKSAFWHHLVLLGPELIGLSLVVSGLEIVLVTWVTWKVSLIDLQLPLGLVLLLSGGLVWQITLLVAGIRLELSLGHKFIYRKLSDGWSSCVLVLLKIVQVTWISLKITLSFPFLLRLDLSSLLPLVSSIRVIVIRLTLKSAFWHRLILRLYIFYCFLYIFWMKIFQIAWLSFEFSTNFELGDRKEFFIHLYFTLLNVCVQIGTLTIKISFWKDLIVFLYNFFLSNNIWVPWIII